MRWRHSIVGMLLLTALAACQLQEITVVDVEDVVVAEVHLQLRSPALTGSRLSAFLHRTIGGSGPGDGSVPGATVRVTRDDGLQILLPEAPIETCVDSTPIDGTGTCYEAQPIDLDPLGPGDRLVLTIDLADGGRMTSATVVPGDFALDGLADGVRCTLPALTPLEVAWSRSTGVWAYVSETLITGLSDTLAVDGMVDDPLYLLGLSISATDTSIVFPGEFGLFNRFELDQGLATALQRGLPAGAEADITITATDPNFVNWVRGGNFNPSGQVRVPSIAGDGTGVFGSSLVRGFSLTVDPDTTGSAPPFPACPAP